MSAKPTTIHDLLAAATDAVNAAPHGGIEERLAEARRRGILDAAEMFGVQTGDLLMQMDERAMLAGCDRPMCGGVWLDKGDTDGH